MRVSRHFLLPAIVVAAMLMTNFSSSFTIHRTRTLSLLKERFPGVRRIGIMHRRHHRISPRVQQKFRGDCNTRQNMKNMKNLNTLKMKMSVYESDLTDEIDETIGIEDGKDDKENLAFFSTLRSLGVDFGLVRTGIAISTGGYQPRPLTILSNLNATQLSSKIVDFVIAEQATNIVLGLPLHKNGTISEQSTLTKEFGHILLQEVRKKCGRRVSVTLWDERYTSKEAASRIAAEAMARNKRIPTASDLEAQLDADAACIILEHYYKDFGKDAEEMVLGDRELEEKCDILYKEHLKRLEEERREAMEMREKGRNARREMIARARALEEQQSGTQIGGKKKKKKKRKK
mmetsp:Transcript_27462/g.53161  ORF Transcript_27462/g.53161 Transcript_27462/m.53161 type:complete len:346 (+) Transcript_27462:97-1134(+)